MLAISSFIPFVQKWYMILILLRLVAQHFCIVWPWRMFHMQKKGMCTLWLLKEIIHKNVVRSFCLWYSLTDFIFHQMCLGMEVRYWHPLPYCITLILPLFWFMFVYEIRCSGARCIYTFNNWPLGHYIVTFLIFSYGRVSLVWVPLYGVSLSILSYCLPLTHEIVYHKL